MLASLALGCSATVAQTAADGSDAGAPDRLTPREDAGLRCVPRGRGADFNGDGYGDLVVSTQTAVYLYPGSARGVSTTPSLRVAIPEARTGGYDFARVAYAGDVNGDGLGDLLYYYAGYRRVDLSNDPPRPGLVHVFHGARSGLATTPSVTLRPPPEMADWFARSANAAGDVDRDGYDDLVVGGGVRGLVVYHGGPEGLRTTPRGPYAVAEGNTPGAARYVRGVGDFDGDGYDDVVAFDDPRALLLHGSAAGLSTDRVDVLDGQRLIVDGVGDVTGDGCPDLFALEIRTGANPFRLYPGGAPLWTPTPWHGTGVTPGEIRVNGSTDFMLAGDLDGDRIDDLLVEGSCLNRVETCPGTSVNEQLLFRGARGGLSTTATPTPGARGGHRYVSVGDLDRDGRDEVAELAAQSRMIAVYSWSDAATWATPRATFAIPDSEDTYHVKFTGSTW